MSSELRHLLAVSEQLVTGQSGAPVVRLIQACVPPAQRRTEGTGDSIAVAFWLTSTLVRMTSVEPGTQLNPRTHAPYDLGRHMFSQIAADIDVDLYARLVRNACRPARAFLPAADIREQWDVRVPHDHHTKRSLAAAGVDYLQTGFSGI